MYIQEKALPHQISFLDNDDVIAEGQEAHWEVVERILFVFAKLNPGLKYIQVCLNSTSHGERWFYDDCFSVLILKLKISLLASGNE